jgi:hypothetical protein|tara:strand:- start:260 stop:838 length:579 start_codon:yes stop_codon:yes gene_type:complete
MKDILDQMASDANTSSSDKIDKLEDGKLDKVSRLANEAARLQEDVDNAEDLYKNFKKSLKKVTDELLPDAMEELGIENLTLSDGSRIEIKPVYSATILVDKKEEAFKFIRQCGDDDIIKNNVTVTFGRGEMNEAEAFTEWVADKGLIPNQTQKIEPSTLRAWFKSRVEDGLPVTTDAITTYMSNHAKITRKR